MEYITSYREVSDELGKKLVKLYKVKIFPRQGKVFADMLFQTGIEAGTFIASLADIEERKMKIDLATNAMIKLNQTEYLLRVMKEAGYYEPAQIVETEEYMEELLKAMRELLSNAFAQLRAGKSVTPVAAPQPEVKKPEKAKPAPAPQPKPEPRIVNVDPDGFNSPAI